eukprot:443885_1
MEDKTPTVTDTLTELLRAGFSVEKAKKAIELSKHKKKETKRYDCYTRIRNNSPDDKYSCRFCKDNLKQGSWVWTCDTFTFNGDPTFVCDHCVDAKKLVKRAVPNKQKLKTKRGYIPVTVIMKAMFLQNEIDRYGLHRIREVIRYMDTIVKNGEKTKELLKKIFDNILNASETTIVKYCKLNINKLKEKTQEQYPLLITVLFCAGFYESMNGTHLLFDHKQMSNLELMNSLLKERELPESGNETLVYSAFLSRPVVVAENKDGGIYFKHFKFDEDSEEFKSDYFTNDAITSYVLQNVADNGMFDRSHSKSTLETMKRSLQQYSKSTVDEDIQSILNNFINILQLCQNTRNFEYIYNFICGDNICPLQHCKAFRTHFGNRNRNRNRTAP